MLSGEKRNLYVWHFKDIYIKIDEIHNGQGYLKKPILKPVSAVVTANLQEDLEQGNAKETFALLLSNNIDFIAVEVVQNYKRRWSIKVFFRNAKQELGLNNCKNSTNENHIHAHLSILFMAESLVRFAQWKYHQKTYIKRRNHLLHTSSVHGITQEKELQPLQKEVLDTIDKKFENE